MRSELQVGDRVRRSDNHLNLQAGMSPGALAGLKRERGTVSKILAPGMVRVMWDDGARWTNWDAGDLTRVRRAEQQ